MSIPKLLPLDGGSLPIKSEILDTSQRWILQQDGSITFVKPAFASVYAMEISEKSPLDGAIVQAAKYREYDNDSQEWKLLVAATPMPIPLDRK